MKGTTAMIWWIILGVLAALILVLLFVPVRLDINYIKDGMTNEVTVSVRYMWLKLQLYPNKKWKKSGKKEDNSKEENPDKKLSFEEHKNKIDGYLRVFKEIKADAVKLLRYLTERAMVFELIDVNIDFGFENAMHTGIFTGVLNGFVYSVLGVIHNCSTLKKMEVMIQPEFDKVCFTSKLRCILRLKNVHIIIIVFNVLKILRKIRKTEGRK